MALCYSKSVLLSISTSGYSRLIPDLWRRFVQLGISRVKPTRRGIRGGQRKLLTAQLSPPANRSINSRCHFTVETPILPTNEVAVEIQQERAHLHFSTPSQLNIQSDTSAIGNNNNSPVPAVVPLNCLPAPRQCNQRNRRTIKSVAVNNRIHPRILEHA